MKSLTPSLEVLKSPFYGLKKAGLRKRINDNCKECIYDDTDAGTWRHQVGLCTIKLCPFWDVRPKSSVQ